MNYIEKIDITFACKKYVKLERMDIAEQRGEKFNREEVEKFGFEYRSVCLSPLYFLSTTYLSPFVCNIL